MPLPMPPLSESNRRQIARSRASVENAGLVVEEIDEIQWRVSAPTGRSVLCFPLEDRWRKDGQWGRGTLTLIAELGGSAS